MDDASRDTAPAAGKLRIAVLGPGGVGGLLAALLTRAGAEVTCVAGRGTVAALESGGLRVESSTLGTFAVRARAVEVLAEPVDACLVCVKATQLEESLTRLPAAVVGNAIVVPLLNGIEHVAVLRRRYPDAVIVPAAIRVESTRVAPGLVRHDSPFLGVELAARASDAARVRELARALDAAGVAVVRSEDERQVLWAKLAFLAPFALLTTHARATAGEVRTRRRADLEALVSEVAAVARADGARTDARQVLEFFDGLPAGMRSSMQRDAEAGRPLELDAIGGAVVRIAARHGIAVPVTARYVAELGGAPAGG